MSITPYSPQPLVSPAFRLCSGSRHHYSSPRWQMLWFPQQQPMSDTVTWHGREHAGLCCQLFPPTGHMWIRSVDRHPPTNRGRRWGFPHEIFPFGWTVPSWPHVFIGPFPITKVFHLSSFSLEAYTVMSIDAPNQGPTIRPTHWRCSSIHHSEHSVLSAPG